MQLTTEGSSVSRVEESPASHGLPKFHTNILILHLTIRTVDWETTTTAATRTCQTWPGVSPWTVTSPGISVTSAFRRGGVMSNCLKDAIQGMDVCMDLNSVQIQVYCNSILIQNGIKKHIRLNLKGARLLHPL